MTTAEVGVDVDFKEAIAMAVLAYWRSWEIKSNLVEVTGAKLKVMLGEIHQSITWIRGVGGVRGADKSFWELCSLVWGVGVDGEVWGRELLNKIITQSTETS